VIHVIGAEIVPSSTYELEVLASSCNGNEDTCSAVSNPVLVVTRRSGDIAAAFNPPSTTTQPDAIDVTQLVNKFKHLPGALSKAIAQLQPNLPELNADINALDIVAVVDAVKGFAYPFSGPCPCPSTVTCNVAACTLPSQCGGGMCQRTCADGPNDGQPCIDDSHCGQCASGNNATYPCDADEDCPGSSCLRGTCGSGFCRDRCGRCDPP
jgi:hypothetical protein